MWIMDTHLPGLIRVGVVRGWRHGITPPATFPPTLRTGARVRVGRVYKRAENQGWFKVLDSTNPTAVLLYRSLLTGNYHISPSS